MFNKNWYRQRGKSRSDRVGGGVFSVSRHSPTFPLVVDTVFVSCRVVGGRETSQLGRPRNPRNGHILIRRNSGEVKIRSEV